ncbi:MAG TPA: ABC transporter permease [Terracidiphilus sp.]|nr:ABC transporter permease [Terracidiphilus sp.]
MAIGKRIFARKRIYAELSESMQEHLAERVDELMSDGLTRAQAEQAARREFGNVALIEQRSREVWQWPTLESIVADLKFALRRLRKSPGFAVAVILTLAIGIGANTAIFSVVNSILIRPLPYPQPEQLVSLHLNALGAPGLADFRNELRLSASMYLTFSEHNRTFQSLGVWLPGTANVTGLAQPEEVRTTLVSGGVLETLDVEPAAGRWLNAADQDPRGTKAVMLGYGYWQERFGGDKGVVGRVIEVDSLPRVIVGVMPRGFKVVNQDFDVLVPLAFDPHHQIEAGFAYHGIARLKPGVPIATADADVARLLNVWMDSWSNGPGSDPHFYLTWKIVPGLRPLKDEVVGNVGGVLWVVMATIGVVMLIACTNVANLLLVRADARQQELAIRSALGAGRGRIARELLMESILLGLIGGAAGVGVALAGLRLLVAIGPANLPRLSEIRLDALSLAFTLVLSLLSGLFFGSIPTLKYIRARIPALHGSGRTASVSRERGRSRNVLVVAQVAMALVLLISAVLMIRTFEQLRHVDPGFSDAAHLETMRIAIPATLIQDPVMATRIQNSIIDKLASIPGVSSAGFAAGMPLQQIEPNWDDVYVEGRTYPNNEPPLRLYNYVSPGYFHTAGTNLIAGRDFTWTDIYGLRPMVMVSEGFARESWGSAQAAIGKRVREYPPMAWHEVIGVVQDVRENGVMEPAPAMVYWPTLMQDHFGPGPVEASRSVTFAVHSSRAGTESFIAEAQQAVWSVNANLPVASIRTMQDIYAQSLDRTSFTLVMLALAGSMALALGIVGIYGVISYAVSQRTREIGIRMALGAKKAELKWMFVRSALLLTGTGVVLGLVAAAGLTRLMKSVLFGVGPLDPLTYAAVPILLIGCAAIASYLPSLRAASIDPVEALRAE